MVHISSQFFYIFEIFLFFYFLQQCKILNSILVFFIILNFIILYNFQLIVLLLMFLMRKHVSLLVALFQESSNCLSELPILYFQPILSFVLLLAFYIFWISVVICLSTASSYSILFVNIRLFFSLWIQHGLVHCLWVLFYSYKQCWDI